MWNRHHISIIPPFQISLVKKARGIVTLEAKGRSLDDIADATVAYDFVTHDMRIMQEASHEYIIKAN